MVGVHIRVLRVFIWVFQVVADPRKVALLKVILSEVILIIGQYTILYPYSSQLVLVVEPLEPIRANL